MSRANSKPRIAFWPQLAMLLLTSMLFLTSSIASAQSIDWPQWGGPHRDFKSDAVGLAAIWPAEGPKRVWMRPMGEGYSSISASDGKLYTMYRAGEREVVIAMEAATGKTVWE